jgi:hypothetical protein
MNNADMDFEERYVGQLKLLCILGNMNGSKHETCGASKVMTVYHHLPM